MSSVSVQGTQSYQIAFGTHTTVAAADSGIATGLREVVGCMAGFGSDLGAVGGVSQGISCHISSTAGAIDIKNWEADGTAGTNFGQTVYWMAWGYV